MAGIRQVYPILYIDGLRLRIGDNGVITTKVAYLAIGGALDPSKSTIYKASCRDSLLPTGKKPG